MHKRRETSLLPCLKCNILNGTLHFVMSWQEMSWGSFVYGWGSKGIWGKLCMCADLCVWLPLHAGTSEIQMSLSCLSLYTHITTLPYPILLSQSQLPPGSPCFGRNADMFALRCLCLPIWLSSLVWGPYRERIQLLAKRQQAGIKIRLFFFFNQIKRNPIQGCAI